MSFLELAQARRSVRGFAKRDVTDESVETLLEAGRAAPSAGNCQPWHFFVVRSGKLQERLASAAYGQMFMAEAPVMLAVCADIPRSERTYGARGRDLYCIQDTAAAIQNILLCAAELGLGACWCGAFDEDAVAQLLHLPGGLRPVALIPVGYPAKERAIPQSRRPLGEVVSYINAR